MASYAFLIVGDSVGNEAAMMELRFAPERAFGGDVAVILADVSSV